MTNQTEDAPQAWHADLSICGYQHVAGLHTPTHNETQLKHWLAYWPIKIVNVFKLIRSISHYIYKCSATWYSNCGTNIYSSYLAKKLYVKTKCVPYRWTYPMWWMYSRALSMPSKMYAMVSSLMPSVKCVQIRSLAEPEKWANTDGHGEKAFTLVALKH